MIFHGSLLKAPQLGIERTMAGFVQAFGLKNKAHKILDYRSLSGTNISDVSVNLLPMTSRKFIRNRMKIIEANATSLANFFLDIDSQKEIFLEIVYPKLSTHKDNELTKKIHFSGFFFNIKFHPQYNSDTFFEIFTEEILKFAKKENCEIVHGASFGFNHTSIYYSVGWDEPENHYLRISPGTETRFEIEALKKVFAQAYFSFKKILSKKI